MTKSGKPTTGSKPDMLLYAVSEYRAGTEIKKRWTRIGAAWAHSDGSGYSIRQEFMPLGSDYSIVLREPLPEKPDGSDEMDIPFSG
jgi:hypothetical protein